MGGLNGIVKIYAILTVQSEQDVQTRTENFPPSELV